MVRSPRPPHRASPHLQEETEIVRAPDGALIKELSLVLNSVGVPHRVVGNQHQAWIVVPSERAMQALEELSNYHRENVGRRRNQLQLTTYEGAMSHALIWCALLALVQLFAQNHLFGLDWRESGLVDGAKIYAGELWRPFTALTLHADIPHLFSNLVFGSVFVALLVQVLGPGLAWSSVLLSAGLGNLVNIFISGADHRSLGASTAVFAALGALTAVQFARKQITARARMTRWVPLIGGALLLAWNGMGGANLGPNLEIQRPLDDNTDIGAHIAGFACGLLVGYFAWLLERRGPLSPSLRAGLDFAAPVLLVLAWVCALSLA